ncbi:hypothetical protein C8F01DRAFT_1248938 [Mycena amicta]|nr:hypothetical protein C8F01DRAFT_1248938 [Mycena amicta]
MVVTKKAPVAPVPTTSRHNSSHAVPRVNKAKQPSSLANGSDTPKEPQPPPPPQNGASTTKSQLKSKHKNRHAHKKPQKQSRSVLDRLGLLALGLFVLYAFTTCPRDTHLSNPVCRSLSQYRTHVLEPYVIPHLNRAISHPSVAPYIDKAERIERETIRPVLVKTVQISGPYAAAVKRVVWDQTAIPTFHAYVVPQWNKHVVPQWNKHVVPQWHKHLSPHLDRAEHTLRTSIATSHKFYATQVQPRLVNSYFVTKPYVVKTYVTVKPRAIAIYSALSARAGTARRSYVDPHVVRMWEKVLELSGAGPIGSPVVPAAAPAANKAVTTSTESTLQQDSTPVPQEDIPSAMPSSTPSLSTEAAPVEITPIVEATTASETEQETVATAEPEPETSSAVESSSASVVEPTSDSVEAEVAAASIAIQSAHGMESPVVEQILEDIKAASSAEEPTRTSSAPIATAVETVSTPAEEDEEDEDLFEFLDDLGISADTAPEESEEFVYEDEDIELTPAELHALKVQQDEEQRIAKERATREKRADLEARMAKSKETLTVMAKEKNKQLRKTLVAMRKAATAKLEDEKSPIGGTVPELEKEMEKVLKGLEGYLKKELKGNKGSLVERTDKWNNVVAKVEERLAEKIQAAQNSINAFHADLRAREVDEGMSIIKELKDACNQAQADVGLDLSWLHDVTYLDWQVYHDLARIGEKFQADASEIQAGTHSHPPVDPFKKKLADVEMYLGAVVNSVVDRVTILRAEAESAFAKAALPPKPSVPVPEAEPEVSILPIDDTPPPSADDGVFEAGKVVIGKSAEQVEEALKLAAEAETEPVHEEL